MNIYIDGAADVKEKLIGYAAFDEKGKEIVAGFSSGEGSNTAELTAIYESLFKFDKGAEITFYTDSLNVMGWMVGGWKVRQPNIQILLHNIRLLEKNWKFCLSFQHVQGHSGIWQNELADLRARQMLDFARKCPTNLKS